MSDLISRQAAIDCEYQVKIINDIEYVMLSEVQMKMRKLPSAQPVQWIPCSERLPEPYESVLIYEERNAWVDGKDYPIRKKEIAIGIFSPDGFCNVYGCSRVKPIAWMPLPEPYREERKEE